MNKTVLGIIVTVVALVAVGGIIVANKKDDTTSTATTSSTSPNPSSGNTAGGESAMPMPPESPSPNPSTSAAVETSSVTIENYAFSPATVKVKKGTKVTWTNRDSVKHDVAPDDASDAFKGSELLAKGESYSFTFNTVGTYSYHCSPHPYMKATVEVVE